MKNLQRYIIGGWSFGPTKSALIIAYVLISYIDKRELSISNIIIIKGVIFVFFEHSERNFIHFPNSKRSPEVNFERPASFRSSHWLRDNKLFWRRGVFEITLEHVYSDGAYTKCISVNRVW